jgi:tryptophanyl-tRNA synthetase
MTKQTIFSGIKPSGNLHLGNYLGAIKQWVAMQENNNCIFCVVDYHAITVPQKPEELAARTLEIAKIYLAAGIDPKKSIIFRQSDIKEHTELAWILNCITNVGELKRMTQFKDKANLNTIDDVAKMFSEGEKLKQLTATLSQLIDNDKKKIAKELAKLNNKDFANNKEIVDGIETLINEVIFEAGKKTESYYREFLENVIVEDYKNFNKSSVGLFDYPVLMAADILLYDTDVVPVGEDQIQHVELARDLAKRFNHNFGETFRIPKAETLKEGARIMGLENPLKKMSKSEGGEANCVYLLDDPEKAAKKIMRATTDSGSGIKYDKENKPGISNLLTIYSLLADKKISEIEADFSGKGYGEFKQALAETIKAFLTSFQKKYYAISNNAAIKILKGGEKKLQKKAAKKTEEVKQKIGIK